MQPHALPPEPAGIVGNDYRGYRQITIEQFHSALEFDGASRLLACAFGENEHRATRRYFRAAGRKHFTQRPRRLSAIDRDHGGVLQEPSYHRQRQKLTLGDNRHVREENECGKRFPGRLMVGDDEDGTLGQVNASPFRIADSCQRSEETEKAARPNPGELPNDPRRTT